MTNTTRNFRQALGTAVIAALALAGSLALRGPPITKGAAL